MEIAGSNQTVTYIGIQEEQDTYQVIVPKGEQGMKSIYGAYALSAVQPYKW